MITAAQIRASRALLQWTQVDLANASGLSEPTIKTAEGSKSDLKSSTINAITRALEDAGIQFIADGVRITMPPKSREAT